MMRQARVLECVRVHVDAVIVFVFMLVPVNVFVNMVVNVDVFMLMFSNVFVNTIVNVAMFMLVLVKVFANVSISLIQLHIYIYHMHRLHTSSSKCSNHPATNRCNAMRRAEANAECDAPHFECEKTAERKPHITLQGLTRPDGPYEALIFLI